MAFAILFFIENGFHINLKDNINEFISSFSLTSASGLYSLFDYFVKVFLPLLAVKNKYPPPILGEII